MRFWGIAIARLSLAAWVGASVFFVAVAIRPIRAPELDSATRALLANLLFPGYYTFGFTLLGTAWVMILLARTRRWIWQLAFVTLALALAAVDWYTIYTPLAEMTRRQWMEHAAPVASFRDYHVASMIINGVGMCLSTIAAILVCVPCEPRKDPQQ